ncbi:MAG: fimbrial protein [Gibbsiella quercinecans]|uniref:fimbrial protein n=1 Tax=Gibbsiella quercinecans TaxID=929813 RepID=UPI003F3D740E
MNKTKVAIFAASMLLGSQATAALASDGTISFTGSVTDQTCTVSVNGGSATETVALPVVSKSVLAVAGDTAGATSFTLSLSDCTTASGNAYAYFEQGANVDITTGRLNNTGTATNVAIQLKDANANAIYIGSDIQSDSPATAAISANGAATLNYSAEYYATGASTSGSVASSVTYSISYL